jgi:hypothetical protein
MSETKPESVPPFDTSKPGPGSESTIITPTKKMISEDHFAASRNTAATLVREKSDPKREAQQVKKTWIQQMPLVADPLRDPTVTVGTGWRLTKKNPRVAEPSDHLEELIPKLARPQTAVGLDAKLLEDHLYEEYRRHENHANLAATEKPSTKQERQAPIQKEIDVPLEPSSTAPRAHVLQQRRCNDCGGVQQLHRAGVHPIGDQRCNNCGGKKTTVTLLQGAATSRLCSNSGISSVGSGWRKNRKGRF